LDIEQAKKYYVRTLQYYWLRLVYRFLFTLMNSSIE